MKRLALTAFLLLASPFAALAAATDAPATDAQIDRLLTVMHAADMIPAVLAQVEGQQEQMVKQMVGAQSLTAEQHKRLETVLAISRKHLHEAMTWEKMEPMYREIYRTTFSNEEMEAMIVFYGSPAGQSIMGKMPQLAGNTMQALQKVLVPMMEGMQRDLKQATADATAP